MVLKGNAVWFYFLQMNWLPPNVFMCILPLSIIFKYSFKLEGIVFIRIREYRLRSWFKGKQIERIFNLLSYCSMQHHKVQVCCMPFCYNGLTCLNIFPSRPPHSFKFSSTSLKDCDDQCILFLHKCYPLVSILEIEIVVLNLHKITSLVKLNVDFRIFFLSFFLIYQRMKCLFVYNL